MNDSPESERKWNFRNDSKFIDSRDTYNWYRWRVYLDESDEVLDQIDRVEYRLHPTFPNPVRTINDRDSKFALSSAGWGVFTMFITVYMKDGSYFDTSYRLKFEKANLPTPPS